MSVATSETSVRLSTLLADYPVTHALRTGEVASPLFSFDFAPYEVSNHAFKPLVRDQAFDAGELAIATFLQAKAYGKPLVLLPAVISGKFQHGGIAYNGDMYPRLEAKDLAGKRIGVRSYTQTTGLWVRAILQQDGLDLDSVSWVTFEDAHLAEYTDPASVVRADPGKKLARMLLDKEIDAAILGSNVPDDPRIRRLYPDPEAAGRAWYEKVGYLPINHMFVVTEALSQTRPDIVRELYRMLKESKERAIDKSKLDTRPFGVEANRKALAAAIEFSLQQGLIPRPMTVDELFDETTALLR